MSRIGLAICSLLLTVVAASETVVLAPLTSPNIEVTVMRKGKPVGGILITFNRQGDEKPYWIGSTDANGKLFPPKLIPGLYRIVGKSGAREGELDLEVVEDSTQPKSAESQRAKFEMNLILPHIGEVESAPVTVWIQNFQGVVVDPSDAVISNSKVEVFRKDNVESGPVIELQTNENGEFSAHLDKGIYVGIFWSKGFASYRMVFEVTDKGVSTLRIPLKVGSAG